MNICICGHVESCHTPECCDKCKGWKPQDLILETTKHILDGNGIKAEYLHDSITLERSMLNLIYLRMLSYERKIQELTLRIEDTK